MDGLSKRPGCRQNNKYNAPHSGCWVPDLGQLSVKGILKYLFGGSRRYCCSFCGKPHNEVANLIEGPDAFICNNCVKICSDVLMKECAEYRESFRDEGRRADSKPAPNDGPAIPRGNSAAPEGPPPVI